MKLYGDELARSIDLRIHAPVATPAAVDAIPPDDRPDGIVVTVLADQSQWQFVLASTAAASSAVRVPADMPASGRWVLVGANTNLGQSVGSGNALAPVKLNLTIATAQLASLAAGVKTTTVPLGSVLPAGTRPLWRELVLTTPFSGGGATSVLLDIGGTVPNDIVAGQSLFAGAPAAMQGTSGTNPNGDHGGQQLHAVVTSDVDLSQLTAGSVTIALFTGALP